MAMTALGLLMCAWTLQSCKDDDLLLTGQPSWLGNSIYERLSDEGQYKTMLRLIDDLGQHDVLSQTGSKTIFAANDSAFQVWFKNNLWGVSSYEQLSLSQKKLLLNNSMVNNAYLIELLSNVSANPPKEGLCMRRETATSIYDSVEVITPDMMPNTKAWAKYKEAGKSIRVMKDATTAPMIHLLPAYMQHYVVTGKDLETLTNNQSSSTKDAWVNGKRVVERDITCKNGYIQKVDGVIESSPNMAEIIRNHSNMSMWSGLLDRFSAPYYDNTVTKEFNRLYDNKDSVYVLRYFSTLSAGARSNDEDPDKEAVDALLKFDPGWNQYMYTNTMDYDLHYDCGVMLVPTDKALSDWWETEGRDLQDNYKTWDSIPNSIIAKLINVNMLESFTSSLPSKFYMVTNDAKETLGITAEDIDSCFMGCNGLVYLTNKVFTPAEFSSVAYPALAHEKTMNVIYWSLSGGELSCLTNQPATVTYNNNFPNYLPYLLSMDSYYSMLLPTNDAMLWYVDPVYYGQEDRETGMDAPTVLAFYYNKRKKIDQRVQAYRYKSLIDEDGNITIDPQPLQSTVPDEIIQDRLKRLVNELIIVGNIEDGHEYYKTKAGSLVRVTHDGGRLAVEGGWQMEKNHKKLGINSDEIFTKKNGKSYQLNDQMPLSAQNSVYLTLKNHPEFLRFFDLIDDENAGLMSEKDASRSAAMSNQGNKNITLMDNFNYSVYVPTNESIDELIEKGLLPTWEDYRKIKNDEDWYGDSTSKRDSAMAVVKNLIVNFLRYHIHDHSVAINMSPEYYDEQEDGTRVPLYITDFESMTRNPKTGRFYPIRVDYNKDQMLLRDVRAIDYMRKNPNATQTPYDIHVVKDNNLYNMICREYWIQNADAKASAKIYSVSDAVVHQIDKPLQYAEMTSWEEILNQQFGRPIGGTNSSRRK